MLKRLLRPRLVRFGLGSILVLGLTVGGYLLTIWPMYKTARASQMQYYVSLPPGWNPRHKWPILVTIDGVNGGAFLPSALRFIHARGDRPFIIVAPVVLSNSGQPKPQNYPYGPAIWAQVARSSAAEVDEQGLLDVVQAVRADYHGEDKFFLTGWSAGGHLTWLTIFTHPEQLAAAAPVCANYAGRGVGRISTAPEREQLPIHAIQAAGDRLRAALDQQWADARTTAQEHGYHNISRTTVPGGHGAYPEQVLNYFSTFLPQP